MMIEMEMGYLDMKPVSVGGLMQIRAWADMTEDQLVWAIEAMRDNLSDTKRAELLKEWANEVACEAEFPHVLPLDNMEDAA